MMKNFYETNKDFRDYVDRYCKNKPITLEQALSHIQVRLAAVYYREVEEEQKNLFRP